MATGSRRGYTTNGRSGGGFGAFVLGILFALAALAVGGWAYLKFGNPPVATADKAFPLEKDIVHTPLHARIDRQMEQPPFGTSEDVFEAGAKVYVAECASCHGTPGHDVAFAKWMYPTAPQLWKKHVHGNVVGVSDDEPGETYWKVKNGIRLTGMPSYEHVLTPAQMWDVTLLVKNADQPLPDPVTAILAGGSNRSFDTGKSVPTATVEKPVDTAE
jgi:mono/diheme cytochrome c family protein